VALASFGGTELVGAGGTDIGATVHGGGELDVLKGGKASGTLFTSGVLETGSAGGLVVSAHVQNTGQGSAGSGLGVFGTASGNTVGSNGQEGVFSGGTGIGATVPSGGFLTIHSGGVGISGNALRQRGELKHLRR
jgi:autotransporter passenger strand-loop-strand repeat protein